MKSMMIQPKNLQLDFAFQDNVGNMLIASSLVIFALSEIAINNDDLEYWNIDERLNKHRTVKDFDAHVQMMLYSLKSVGPLEASIIKSSRNNYHFVEFNAKSNGACIRVLHTFNPKAHYMKKYLDMNENTDNPRFAYIQYSLDNTKTKVRKIKVVIPRADRDNYGSCNLIPQFELIKKHLGFIIKSEINEIMRLLKNEVTFIPLSETEIT